MFNFFKKSKPPENLKEISKLIASIEEKIISLDKRLEKIETSSRVHFQKIGLVRFDAFSGTGGQQSFSLALLNKKNNGFVLTSLFGEGRSRVFAKEIKNSKSVRSLSEEEKQAISQAK